VRATLSTAAVPWNAAVDRTFVRSFGCHLSVNGLSLLWRGSVIRHR
jgi:hypothetical protein